MEVVRDRADNCIIICSIENIDPMGVHTGDSITVAPALTLTDKEYQRMRNASIAVLREIGVDTGGSNVQFALDATTGRMVVIEMNPRVSRSSALASKATGFPIAKVAAKLAVGYTLDEIQNDITGATPASFEPTIDYVVTKIPRFTFEKFPETEPLLTTAMKSVGEVMAMGRTFKESLQKALRGLETGLSGLDEIEVPALPATPAAGGDARRAGSADTGPAAPDRPSLPGGAGLGRDSGCVRLRSSVPGPDPGHRPHRAALRLDGLPGDAASLHALKADGFSDKRLADLTGLGEDDIRAAVGSASAAGVQADRHLRRRVRRAHALLYGCYETGILGDPFGECEPAQRPAQGDHPGRRPEPDRPGHRVRLLLRARLVRPARGGTRDRDDQLQPGDGLDRPRHLGPPLFRAAHRGGRARDLSAGGVERRASGRDRLAGRPDAASCATRWRRRRRPDPGRTPDAIDLADSRALPAVAASAGTEAAGNDICVGVTDAIEERRRRWASPW